MSIRSLCLLLAAMTLLMNAPVLLAQNPLRQAQGGEQSRTAARPDLSGIWTRTGPRPNENFGKETPPLQAWAKAIYDENRRGLAPAEGGLDEMDPTIYCLPHGFPRAMTVNYPFEIVQTPNVVYILFESTQMQRRVYMDGRKMPDGYPSTFLGFSTGKYEGDTLVVETVGLNDLTWMDGRAIPHSDALRVTERIRRASPTALEIDFRFEDPQSFERPWTAKKTFESRPNMQQIMEMIGYCEDRSRYNYQQKVFKGTVRWQSPEQAEGKR